MISEKNIIFPLGITGKTITFRIQQVSNNYWLDNLDGVFRLSPSSIDIPSIEINGAYFLNENRTEWTSNSTSEKYVVFAIESGTITGYGELIVKNDQGTVILEAISHPATISSGSINSKNYIWNTSTLAWEAATGSLTGGGNVTVNNFPSSYPVTGTFWQTTQPISATNLPLPIGASTSNLQLSGNSNLTSIDGKITTTTNGIKVDGSAITQPISGTITATQTIGSNLHTVVDSATNISQLPISLSSLGNLKVDLAESTTTVAVSGNISNISGTVSLPINAATETTLSSIYQWAVIDGNTFIDRNTISTLPETKGLIVFGKDTDSKVSTHTISPQGEMFIKSLELTNDIKNILIELKKINQYLSLLIEVKL